MDPGHGYEFDERFLRGSHEFQKEFDPGDARKADLARKGSKAARRALKYQQSRGITEETFQSSPYAGQNRPGMEGDAFGTIGATAYADQPRQFGRNFGGGKESSFGKPFSGNLGIF
jgi:hypothetical protein